MNAPTPEQTDWRKSSYSGTNANCVECALLPSVDPEWRKSSYSGTNTNCVECAPLPSVDPEWRKSSYSGTNTNCVECAPLPSASTAVRDSKHPDAGHLTFTAPEWTALLATLKTRAL